MIRRVETRLADRMFVNISTTSVRSRFARRLDNDTKLLLHNCTGFLGILERMRDQLVAEQLIHLLQRFAACLRVKEEVTQCSAQVKDEKRVEEAESDLLQRDRRYLSEDQVKHPIADCRQRVAARANFGAEDLGWVSAKWVSVLSCHDSSSSNRNAGGKTYTHVMIPIMVKKNENTKFMATIALSALPLLLLAPSLPAT